MNYLEIIVVNTSLICFPILVYLIFDGFKKNFKQNVSDTILELILIIITFILMYFYHSLDIDVYVSSFTIPILISFMFNKTRVALLNSFITITFSYQIFSINIYVLLTLFIIHYTVYYIYERSTKSLLFLVNTFSLSTVFTIITHYYLTNNLSIKCLFIVSVYLITIYGTISIINASIKKIKTYKTLKEIEDDKILKTSIFKVTHEIKNPLAVIKGYLYMFDSKDSDKCERYKNILEKEVDNALLVLKDFSEINHLSIDKKNMSFNSLLCDIKETILPFFNDKHITYYFKTEQNINIFADYNRLKQVFVNILKNSTEALDENGTIDIKAYTQDKKLIIIVKDNGTGMDKDTLDNLFTPYYSKKSYGSGLGLCLSKEIIEAHSGTINYTSVKNKHTTVKIILPV